MDSKPPAEEIKAGEIFRQCNGTFYFVCYHCGDHFQLAETIIEHIQTVHFRSSTIKAEHLDEEHIFAEDFPSVDALFDCSDEESHRKPKANPLICDYCCDEHGDVPSMEAHMQLHANKERPFVCTICRQQFKRKNLLNGHKKVAHATIDDIGAGEIVCIVCAEKFKDSKAYDKHIAKRHTKYKCTQCDCQYNQKRNLRFHIKVKHAPAHERPCHPCPDCGLTFVTRPILTNHIRLFHTKETPYHCALCDTRYSTSTQYSMHMVRHQRSSKQHQCTKCGKISNYRKCIDKNCYTPLAKRPPPDPNRVQLETAHVCNDCGKIYKRLDYLVKHRKSNCLQKVECPHCHKLMKDKRILHYHIAEAHNDEQRKLPCRYCDMVFLKRWQRFSHEKKHKNELI